MPLPSVKRTSQVKYTCKATTVSSEPIDGVHGDSFVVLAVQVRMLFRQQFRHEENKLLMAQDGLDKLPVQSRSLLGPLWHIGNGGVVDR